jgi:hypothetical protein
VEPALFATFFTPVSCLAYFSILNILLGLFFDLEDGGDISPKRRLTFNELHSVMSQKTLFLIVQNITA